MKGDGAAAMRYTEARLQKITQEAYLADLDKNVVDFVSNFDETEKEPVVLPSRYPNLLVKRNFWYCGWYGNKYSTATI